MLTASRIRHRGLKAFFQKGQARYINPDWRPRVAKMLAALNIATRPSELDLSGWRFHELTGDLSGTFSLRVTANQRITFKWDDSGPYDVDLEDYHG